MKELFDQVRAAANGGLYYLALMAALAIPDICAGLEAPDGQTNGNRYATWFDKYVGQKYLVGPWKQAGFTGSDCYLLRCSMLHQGTTQKAQARYRQYVFTPGRGVHANVFSNITFNGVTTSFVQFSIEQFCDDVVEGALQWLFVSQNTSTFQANYSRFMRLYPAGYPEVQGPRLFGGPVIT